MNDFTKEELEIMRRYLQKEQPTPPESHINLLWKIQSIIDNYCEHEIKITKRVCPLCSSDFKPSYINEWQNLETHCSNGMCGYSFSFPVGSSL